MYLIWAAKSVGADSFLPVLFRQQEQGHTISCSLLSMLAAKVRLKHGLMCVSRTLMFKKYTEGHALTYLKYVTIATFDLGQL